MLNSVSNSGYNAGKECKTREAANTGERFPGAESEEELKGVLHNAGEQFATHSSEGGREASERAAEEEGYQYVDRLGALGKGANENPGHAYLPENADMPETGSSVHNAGEAAPERAARSAENGENINPGESYPVSHSEAGRR